MRKYQLSSRGGSKSLLAVCVQIIPGLLSQICPAFSFSKCSFKVSVEHKTFLCSPCQPSAPPPQPLPALCVYLCVSVQSFVVA